MDYSIVIPVFNKAGLTRNCLQSLERTLKGAGEGEVIVIDNASSDETPQVLAEFPWIRAVRNDRNLGFAGATNQGARMASGRYLVLLNNDIVAHPGWLSAMLRAARETEAGAVGAKLLYPSGSLQHAGVVVSPNRLGSAGFTPFHAYHQLPGDFAAANVRREYQVITAACLLTPRDVYWELGGLDEAYWNGYEDVDYCLKLRRRGLKVVYEPAAQLTHFESQSGPERFRQVSWNIALLARRWDGSVRFDLNDAWIDAGSVMRTLRRAFGNENLEYVPVPEIALVLHGAPGENAPAALHRNRVRIARTIEVDDAAAIGAVRREMEHRADRYVALVARDEELEEGWLDELVRQIQFAPNTAAATFSPELPLDENVCAFTAGARCTLLHLAKFPLHLRLDDLDTLDGSVADFLIRALPLRVGTRGAASAIARLPGLAADAAFESRYGMAVSDAVASGAAEIERVLRAQTRQERTLASIVMLSWNAPQFTKMALESIRAHTAAPYEVIIVDNGSGPETVDWLRTLEQSPEGRGVRVIYNAENRGFAGGNNQALADARGDYVVMLNNDVIVTEGWLERLLGAFDRIPGLGVSAPRSNKIAGDQIVADARYDSLDAMHEYARLRAVRYRDRGYMTDRAIGLCLCIDRRVIEEIGGIDERFGVGNFEDDDFCLRVRAAGYGIHVCDDVFIHHFGSQTFAANKVDWTATMRENWTKFATKWSLPEKQENGGYQPLPAIRRGFIREKHYVPLSATGVAESTSQRAYRVVFTAPVRNDAEWEGVAAFARRFLRAFDASSPALLAIGAFGEMRAQTLGSRVRKIAEKLSLDPEACADVEISDESDEAAWRESLPGEVCIGPNEIGEHSPSALRRYVDGVPA